MRNLIRANVYRLLHARSWWVLTGGLVLYALVAPALFAMGWRSEGVATFAEAVRRAEAFELVMVLLPIWFAWFFGSDLTNRTLRHELAGPQGRRLYIFAAAVLIAAATVAVMAVCGALLAFTLVRLDFALTPEAPAGFFQRLGLLALFATAYGLVAAAVALAAGKNAAALGIAAAALLTSTVLFSFARAALFSLPAPVGPALDGVLATYSLSGMFTVLEGTGVVQPWWFAQAALVAVLAVLAAVLILRRKELR